jgi:hypothetical protein
MWACDNFLELLPNTAVEMKNYKFVLGYALETFPLNYYLTWPTLAVGFKYSSFKIGGVNQIMQFAGTGPNSGRPTRSRNLRELGKQWTSTRLFNFLFS